MKKPAPARAKSASPAKRAKPTKSKQPKAAAQAQIEYWPLSRFIAYARNPRKNDHAVDKMAASIREFGFKVPILARSNGDVVDGHLRLKAAAKLELEPLPVILCDDWTEGQVKAFRLMVNRSVGWAEWDMELLGPELLELQGLDFDLALTGFDADELTRYTESAGDAFLGPDEGSPVHRVQYVDCPKCGEHFRLAGRGVKLKSAVALPGPA